MIPPKLTYGSRLYGNEKESGADKLSEDAAGRWSVVVQVSTVLVIDFLRYL